MRNLFILLIIMFSATGCNKPPNTREIQKALDEYFSYTSSLITDEMKAANNINTQDIRDVTSKIRIGDNHCIEMSADLYRCAVSVHHEDAPGLEVKQELTLKRVNGRFTVLF